MGDIKDVLKSRKGKYVIAIVVGYLLTYVPGWIGGLGFLIAGGTIAVYILSWMATSLGPKVMEAKYGRQK